MGIHVLGPRGSSSGRVEAGPQGGKGVQEGKPRRHSFRWNSGDFGKSQVAQTRPGPIGQAVPCFRSPVPVPPSSAQPPCGRALEVISRPVRGSWEHGHVSGVPRELSAKGKRTNCPRLFGQVDRDAPWSADRSGWSTAQGVWCWRCDPLQAPVLQYCP